MIIEVVQTDNEQPFHVRIKGDNGEPIAHSESYPRRSHAIEAVAALAAGFGVRGAYTVLGPPGNTTVAFTATQYGGLPAERRFPIVDVDERTPGAKPWAGAGRTA